MEGPIDNVVERCSHDSSCLYNGLLCILLLSPDFEWKINFNSCWIWWYWFGCHSYCTRLWIRSLYNCFFRSQEEVYHGSVPEIERYGLSSLSFDTRSSLFQFTSYVPDENIGNSRDCSFEQMILVRTDGKGVDYVLNSLSEDKLAASVRCLGRGGVFLEIGKFDIMNNSKLDMGSFAKEIEFRAVFADNLIYMPKEREIVFKMIEKDLENGLIQPLHSTVFQVKEVEKAFRFLSTGKHIGKVLIQIRETEKSTTSLPMTVFKRTVCDPHMVYIIAGGLGGFGLELADWLVLRGARKVMLSSRRGVMNGYQAYRIK